MITDPIKNIIDQYAAIADQNKEKFGKEYAAKYGCYKNGNYSDFRPSNSEKKEPSVAQQLDAMIKKGEAQQGTTTLTEKDYLEAIN